MVEQERFLEPQPNLIESTAGFTVRILGRTGMRYSEGGRSVWIDSEVLAKPRAIFIWTSSVTGWEAPYDSEPMSERERQRIIGNVRRAFEGCGYELQGT